MYFMWKRRHIRRFLGINTSLWRLKASRVVGLCRNAKGTRLKWRWALKDRKRLWCFAQTTCVVFFCCCFFFTVRVLQLGEQQQKQRWWPPRGSGPCTGAQRSFISVTVCKQQFFPEAFPCYFWPFSLTSFKDSKQINKIKLIRAKAARTQESFSRGLNAAPSLAGCGSRCRSWDSDIWDGIPAEQRRRRCWWQAN